MNIPVHRNTDSRNCGASTTVQGQSTVFVNNLLASVQGDPNTHGGGALSATVNDGTVFINGIKVVLKGSDASSDSLCIPLGGPHCNPKSVGASSNVYACGGGPGAGGGGYTHLAEGPDPSGSELYPDPNAQSSGSVSEQEDATRDAVDANDPSSDGSKDEPPASQAEAEQRAYQYFIDQGYTPEQAAGIVGNLVNESGLNPEAIAHNDAGYGRDSEGIAQWNRDRLENLQGFAASQGTNYQDFDTQLAYIDHELRGSGANGGGSESAAYNRLQRATTTAEAAEAFSTYERYRGYELGLQGRETQERAADAARVLSQNS